ncbi:hypothetical protein H1R20_g6, partial [Candolleomyces eurysporus]
MDDASTEPVPDLGGVRLWNSQGVGMVNFIRVDGRLYGLLGTGGGNETTIQATYITATQTIFTLRTGPVDLNLTFLSPIETSDWARQSLPLSYLSIDVTSRDGSAHSVQFYAHVTAEWISSDLEATTQSSTTRSGSVVYHTTTRTSQTSFSETNDIAQDTTLVFAALSSNALTTQIGPSAGLRADFDQRGQLSNSGDGSAMPISPAYPAVAFALDLGSISSTPSPTTAVFALGVLRDPVIRYERGSAVELRRPYWTTRWGSIGDALGDFLSDFPSALSRAQALDMKIMADASAAAPTTQHADLVALAARQVFAAIDITTGQSNGNPRDVRSFMRNVGVDRRISPVDSLYASFPGLLYFNASFAGALLEPLLESQELSEYQHPFASPDLGASYPVSSLNNSDTQNLAVESCASMLIMSWLYTQKSGSGTLVDRYYALLKKWADYLVDNALRPSTSYTSDGLTTPNNANLALKGILGLHSMAQINNALASTRGKDSSLTEHYAGSAKSYYSQWETLALSSGRMLSSYDDTSSWAMAYNLYPALLMGGVEFIGKSVYDGQTSFYSSRLAGSGSNFGIGYDSTNEYIVKSHWTLFTAATVTSTTLRDNLIRAVHNRTFMNGVTPPFSTTWDLRSGASPPSPIQDGRARCIFLYIIVCMHLLTSLFYDSPVQGAMLSLMALNLPNPSITFDQTAIGGDGSVSGGTSKKTNIGAIAGGVVGGVFVAIAVGFFAFFFVRRRRRMTQPEEGKPKPILSSQSNDDDNGRLDLGAPPPPVGPASSSSAANRSPTTSTSFISRLFNRQNEANESSLGLVPSPFTATAGSTTSSASAVASSGSTEGPATAASLVSSSGAPMSEKQRLLLQTQQSDLNINANASLIQSPSSNSTSTGMYTSPVSANSGQQGLFFPQSNSASSTSASHGEIGGSGWSGATPSSFNSSSGGGGGGYGRIGLDNPDSIVKYRYVAPNETHPIPNPGFMASSPETAVPPGELVGSSDSNSRPSSGNDTNLTPAQQMVVNEDLRAEVVELRRQMEEIRARTASNRFGDVDEPPPSYST